MSVLKNDFHNAIACIDKIKTKLNKETLSELYGLYKQATIGDIVEINKDKLHNQHKLIYKAWHKLKGNSKEEAMQKYVSIVKKITNIK